MRVRVRTYGLILLVCVIIIPWAVYAGISISRAQRTSDTQVREGNLRLAEAVAGRIHSYIEHERALIATIGASILHLHDDFGRQRMLDLYKLDQAHRHLQNIVIYNDDGQIAAGHIPDGLGHVYDRLRDAALEGRSDHSAVRPAHRNNRFAHTFTLGQPVRIAGTLRGAIVACYDMVGVWQPIDQLQFGETGFASLLTKTGQLLAHSNPDKRPNVFSTTSGPPMRETGPGQVVESPGGADLLVSESRVLAFDWVVRIEQEANEAFAAIQDMKRDLAIVGLSILLLAVALGLLFGSTLVRTLERMRAHTRKLVYNLDDRLSLHTYLSELEELAESLNTMASDLMRERDTARARERLTTFARVAAGLAHDLRMPIEAVRGACEEIKRAPEDVNAQELIHQVCSRDLPRLRRFVDDLQRLAHLGNLGLEYQSVTPETIVAEIMDEMQSKPKWQGVIFVDKGRGMPAQLDANLIRRAVLNLASNAADACLEVGYGNTVTIEIADEADGNLLEIRISDTGVGIAPERLAILRDGDFQSTKRVSGVGLGLGVARQVAVAHGGELDMSSQVGEGSTFTLRLPRFPGESPAVKAA